MSLVSSLVSSSSFLLVFCFYLVSFALVGIVQCSKVPVTHPLTLDFYSKTCPQLDQLVASVTASRFRQSPISGPATIRLFFHDCFVEGCDASILVAPGSEGSALVEREMPENKNLPPEGFDTVAMAKTAVESKCPGVVSCADILAIATRDFVHLAGGPYYPVKKGRKDNRVSKAIKVRRNLPSSNTTIDRLVTLFAAKGLTKEDLVALSGAHSIGFAHCDQFVGRLYDFQGTKKPDPFIDARLLKVLQMYCPRYGGNTDVVAPLDVQTPFSFDHMYYGNLEAKLGLLGTDQGLYLDPRTRPFVEELGKDKAKFFEAFVLGMERLGSIKVKKGKRGEIRKDCSKHLS